MNVQGCGRGQDGTAPADSGLYRGRNYGSVPGLIFGRDLAPIRISLIRNGWFPAVQTAGGTAANFHDHAAVMEETLETIVFESGTQPDSLFCRRPGRLQLGSAFRQGTRNGGFARPRPADTNAAGGCGGNYHRADRHSGAPAHSHGNCRNCKTLSGQRHGGIPAETRLESHSPHHSRCGTSVDGASRFH